MVIHRMGGITPRLVGPRGVDTARRRALHGGVGANTVETKHYARSRCPGIILRKSLGSVPPRRNGREEHLKEAGGHYPELMQQLVKVRLGRPLLAEPLRAVGACPESEPGM